MTKKVYLSHIISKNTPLYGGRNEHFNLFKTSDITEGKTANDTRIETTVHIGTHVDMPYHFYSDGQTIEDFSLDYWFFTKPLYVEIVPKGFVIFDEIVAILNQCTQNDYDILIVKTGIGVKRGTESFWQENYGFSPLLYDYLKSNFPSIRVLGFDSISISSWQERELGKLAHKAFLNPQSPILILEDMDLSFLHNSTTLKEVIIAPLRIEKCDGLPCSVIGIIDEQ